MCVRVCVHTFVCDMYSHDACMRVYVCMCYMGACVYAYMYISVCMSMYIYAYDGIYAGHMHTFICAWVCFSVHVCTYVCQCVFVCV